MSLLFSLLIVLVLLIALAAGAFIGYKYVYKKGKKLVEKEQKKLEKAKQKKIRKQQKRESELIHLAEKKGGRLSVSEVVASTNIDAQTAEEMLDEMTRRGTVDMQISESGVIVYEFLDLSVAEGDKGKKKKGKKKKK